MGEGLNPTGRYGTPRGAAGAGQSQFRAPRNFFIDVLFDIVSLHLHVPDRDNVKAESKSSVSKLQIVFCL